MKILERLFVIFCFAVIIAFGFCLGVGYEQHEMAYLYGERPDFRLGLEVGKMLAQPVSRMELKKGAVIRGVIFESSVEFTRGIEATIEDCEWPAVGGCDGSAVELSGYCRDVTFRRNNFTVFDICPGQVPFL